MKLLKIGSAPSCDIVLNSEFVSSHHADITILDNGEIVIEDKNSTNGTFVGTKKLNPNQEVPIKRGDYVRLADTDLVWSRIPSPEKNTKYKTIVNIGSNFRNDIVLNSSTVSRYHATLKVEKGGKAYLVDNGSKNGTQVNGVRVSGPTRVKRGDNVLIGGEDITEQLKQFIPSSIPSWAWIAGGVAAVAATVALIWAMIGLVGPSTSVTPNMVRPTVVYVQAAYHYEVTLEDNPFTNEEYKKELVKETPGIPYMATAFFIDKEGRMATNRHVAVPWEEEYREDGMTENLRDAYQAFLLEQFKVSGWEFFYSIENWVDAIRKLKQTELGNALLDECDNLEQLQAKIRIIQSSKILISGKIDYITVGYPGRNYTHMEEFQRCYVLSESGNKEVDLAILQLNDKKTPESLANNQEVHILNPLDAVEDQITPLKEEYCVIGYPLGLKWGLDDKTHALEPSIRTTKCAKQPSKYTFEFDSDSYGGASGSPLFNEKGQLVGVLCSGYVGTSVTYAVHARFLKDMYKEEVGISK